MVATEYEVSSCEAIVHHDSGLPVGEPASAQSDSEVRTEVKFRRPCNTRRIEKLPTLAAHNSCGNHCPFMFIVEIVHGQVEKWK
jgi:hypothetical protein